MPRQRTYGIRFSAADGAALAVCVAATYFAHRKAGIFAWLIPVALGHFFLFCNIFRLRRKYELVWAAIFLVNFGGWLLAEDFTWLGVLGVQTPLTIAAIILEMRSPRYHGIGARRLNPQLEAYLAGDIR